MRKLTDWEIDNGFVRYNHFYRPLCCILRNGEIMAIHGEYEYPYYVALKHIESEQPYSNDSFSIDIFYYKPNPIEWYDNDTQEKIRQLFCDGVSIK